MIAKNIRFHGHGALRYLYKNADTYRSRYGVIRIITNPKRKSPRLAVVISKKTHKSAVGRNRIRRRVYEILRHELPGFQQSYDIAVIITNAEALSAPHEDIKKSIQTMLAQAGVYKQPL